MERDYVIKKAIKRVRETLAKEFDIDLPDSSILAIFKSQFDLDKYMEDERTIKIDYMFKFIVKPGRKDAVQNVNKMKEAGMSDEEISKAKRFLGTSARVNGFKKDVNFLINSFKKPK